MYVLACIVHSMYPKALSLLSVTKQYQKETYRWGTFTPRQVPWIVKLKVLLVVPVILTKQGSSISQTESAPYRSVTFPGTSAVMYMHLLQHGYRSYSHKTRQGNIFAHEIRTGMVHRYVGSGTRYARVCCTHDASMCPTESYVYTNTRQLMSGLGVRGEHHHHRLHQLPFRAENV